MRNHIFPVAIFLMCSISCIQMGKVIQSDNPTRTSLSPGLLQPMDFSRMATPKAVLDSLTEAGVNPEEIRRPAKKFLLNLYNQLQHGGDISETLPGAGGSSVEKSLKNADTVRSLTAKVPVYEGSGRVKLTFNLTSLSDTEVAHHAELHIRPLQHRHDKHRHKFSFTILSQTGRTGQKVSYRLSSTSKTYNGYLVFDITSVIQKLIEKSSRSADKVLEVRVSHKAMHGKRKTRNTKNEDGQQSFGKRSLSPLVKEDDGILLLYTKDNAFFEKFRPQVKYAGSSPSPTFTHDKQLTKRRRRRNVSSQLEENQEQLTDKDDSARVKRSSANKKDCGLKEFIVDFKKLGWDKWIVFPHTYNAFMCNGRCSTPVDWSLNPTNHAVLQSLMRLSDRTVPKPCCVPTKLDALSMIYFEYEEIVVRHHEGMVVSKCGCR